MTEAFAGEIPRAVWRFGQYDATYEFRLSPSGTRFTVVSTSDLKVVDIGSMTCVHIDDYQLRTKGRFDRQMPSRTSAVTSNGSHIVTCDTSGFVIWRGVEDTSVVSTTSIPANKWSSVQLVDDTTAFVAQEDSGCSVTLHGVLTFGKLDPRPLHLDALLGLWVRDTSVYVVRLVVRDTIRVLLGAYLGTDRDGRVYMYNDSIVTRYTSSNAWIPEIVMSRAFVPKPIIRQQFLSTRDTLVDLVDGSRHTNMLYPDDIMPGRTAIKYDRYTSRIFLSRAGRQPDTIHVFDGPVVRLFQDPRDTLHFIQTRGMAGSVLYGPIGRIGFVTSSEVYLPHQSFAPSWTDLKFIRDSLAVEYTTLHYDAMYGYTNLDRLRARLPLGGVKIEERFPSHDRTKPTYDFSSNGDTLRLLKKFVDFNSCPTDTIVDSSAVVAGFVSTTPHYVVGRHKYDVNTCTENTLLPAPVVSISPHTSRVVLRSDDMLYLADVSTPEIRIAYIQPQRITVAAWADSGTTVRCIRDNSTIVSMHSSGRVDSVALPASMQTNRVGWFWSHDGNVATGLKSDTLMSIDVRTGAILREYADAQWLSYVHRDLRAICLVGQVDGSLIVSLPSGCVATFPGIDLPVLSSVAESSRPLRLLQIHSTRIEGASPHTTVMVYSLLGTVAFEGVADVHGSFELADKGLSHGAYVVLYTTALGPCSRRVLL